MYTLNPLLFKIYSIFFFCGIHKLCEKEFPNFVNKKFNYKIINTFHLTRSTMKIDDNVIEGKNSINGDVFDVSLDVMNQFSAKDFSNS